MSVTRAKTMTILDVVAASNLIKVNVRIPQHRKKRKAKSTGTVTGHYISFLKDTLDEMDKFPDMKGHYIVMGSVPIHANKDIAKHIEY
jgi:hypothetical protein